MRVGNTCCWACGAVLKFRSRRTHFLRRENKLLSVIKPQIEISPTVLMMVITVG